MAWCQCRWYRVLICLCTPCICLALLLLYVSVVLCLNMAGKVTMATMWQVHHPDDLHFVASGTVRNKSFAPLPKTFWENHPHPGAFWNQLQLHVDRYFNPILHPDRAKRRGTFHDSPLTQSFHEATKSNNRRRNFNKLPQQLQEFVRYMQSRDYPTLLQPDGVCGAQTKDEKEPPLLLFAIKTTRKNFMNRQAIRQTWGRTGWVAGHQRNSSKEEEVGGYVRRVFLLGKEKTKDQGVDESDLLVMEHRYYGDILQWDFDDTFFNLTLKDVLFWNWFSGVCGQTRFVFKGDDDVFVNTPRMISYLQDHLKKPQAHETMEDFMVGDVIGAAKPDVVNNSKYFIPDTFYEGLYPMYAGGGGVLYSGLLAKRLHLMSRKVHLFPIDDVYVGMCVIRLNAAPVHHPAFLTFDFPKKEKEELCRYHTILLVHKRSPDQVVKLWRDMKKTETQCLDVPLRTEVKNKH